MNIDIEKWLRRPPVILPGCSPIVAMEAMVSHWDLIDRIEKIKKNREGLAVNYEYLKGSEKDFEQAPEWAMVLLKHNNGRCVFAEGKSIGAKRTEMYGAGYCIITVPNEYEIIAKRRPITEPVWDGEGVPCVGQKVMTKSGEGIIDYVGSGVIVYSNNDGQWSVRCDSLDYSLSAIRSPEDVARDEAIDAIFSILSVNILDGSDSNAGKVFDAIAAGKIPGVKLE